MDSVSRDLSLLLFLTRFSQKDRRFRVRLFLFLCFLSSYAIPAGQAEEVQCRISSANPAATQAGLSVMKSGGNAVDAAIAVQAVLNVVEPQSSGIGGGCFLLFYDSVEKNVAVLDGREEAPRSTTPEMFLGPDNRPVPFYPDRVTGGKPVGVPGCLKALHKMWLIYGSGKIPWEDLFAPAIELAEKGFQVSPRLAEAIESEKDRLKLFPASLALFFTGNETPKKEGDILISPDLAQTFRLVARKGPYVFYEGEIADDILKAINASPVNPGSMTREDLTDYEAPFRKPLSGTYRGLDVYTTPSPSAGGTSLLECLNILALFDVPRMNRSDPEFVRLFSEVQRVVFLDRSSFLGDGDFSGTPAEDLLTKEWAVEKKKALSLIGRLSNLPATEPEKHGNTTTSHISIVDPAGNVLSMTTTIEHIFGCAMVVPGRGFVLNNELTDFDALPWLESNPEAPAPNRPEGVRRPRKTSLDIPESLGGKRPSSSMTPVILFEDGKPVIVLGSPGGTQITSIVLNVLVNLIDFKMSPKEAMAAPRILYRKGPLELEEALFKNSVFIDQLKQMGYEIIPRKPFGNAQLIVISDGGFYGAADPRGEGRSDGF